MADKIKVHDRLFEIMIPEAKIQEAVRRVADQLNRDYTSEDNVLILGVLNGSFMFMSDLVRMLNFKVEVNFIKIASYDGLNSTGEVRELIGFNSSPAGRKVIVVEDIVDTGNSIMHTMAQLDLMGAVDAKVCTLFFKPNAYRGDIKIDYVAMEIGDEFIVGYGLDYNQLGRTFKDVYVTKDE